MAPQSRADRPQRDATILLDWKWRDAGGDLARWEVADVEEFLLG